MTAGRLPDGPHAAVLDGPHPAVLDGPYAAVLDWPRAMAAAACAVSRPEVTRDVVRAAERAGPVFRNRDFPLSPLPVLVRTAAAERLCAPLTDYVRLLGTVVRLFRAEPEVRRWYGLGPAAEQLIDADTGPADAPWVCRLDGYLDQDAERLVLLENNADAPAGTLFTPRVNQVVAGVARALDPRAPTATRLTYQNPDAFRRVLLAAAGATADRTPGKQRNPRHLAVLQPAGRANRESMEMVAAFRTAGLDAYLADPRDLRVVAGRASFGDRPADLAWNKVNTVGWQAMAADEELVRRWVRALRETPLVHVNPFGARYVAESKLTLALVQEPRFATLFTAAERALAAGLLPWSRKVTVGGTGPDGRSPLTAELLEHPAGYVLKQPYDIRGDGVTIGWDVPRSRWRAAVEAAVRGGHLAQRAVRPTRYPVVAPGSSQVVAMAISLDTYVLGGAVAGFGSKASRQARVNVFQGGQKLAVHVVSGEPG